MYQDEAFAANALMNKQAERVIQLGVNFDRTTVAAIETKTSILRAELLLDVLKEKLSRLLIDEMN
jgi:hypothetical protein